jgi:tRNA (cmo5U34)-methyltransferase
MGRPGLEVRRAVGERRALTRDEFFFVKEDNYDDHVERAIPLYREMHEEAIRSAAPHDARLRILDLGSGTGKTAYAFLHAFPDSRVRCLELFEEMERHARDRLGAFGDRVEYVLGDFMEIPLGQGYDVCVSALAIHHQPSEGKRELFRRVHEALAPGGRFLMIDWTRFESPTLQNISFIVAQEHLRAHVSEPRIVEEWADHWKNRNIPDTVEDMLSWLKDVGFERAECVLRYYGMALVYARKGLDEEA